MIVNDQKGCEYATAFCFMNKTRACLPFIFAMKITKNSTFFKEKVKFDGRSIKRAFDFEPKDLAIFMQKRLFYF